MFTIRLISRRNPLRRSQAFATPISQPHTAFLRTYSDGDPVIVSEEIGNATIDSKSKQSKSAASVTEDSKVGKKPRRKRSDAGKPRKAKSESKKPPEPSVESPKPRKIRKDAGVAKGPKLEKTFASIIQGGHDAPNREDPETDGGKEVKRGKERKKPGKRKSTKETIIDFDNITHIDFRRSGDRVRQNIVSQELCDDVLQRLAPSLEKHKGCDIIDINPGVGVWSSKLHDMLKPRTHIMMEPDHKTYLPYLKRLLDQKESTYKLIPLSGIIWNNLNKLESEGHLPHQKLRHLGDPELEKPNNTLLLTANLGYWPRRSYIGFPSITNLVVHQLLTASRAHSIFQGYGQVRMLIWMHDHEKRIVLPRLVTNRKKSTVEAEISCAYIHEVAGADQENETFRREQSIDLLSAQRVAPIMAAAGLHTPPHRAGMHEREARDPDLSAETAIGVRRPYEEELASLEARFARREFAAYYDENGEPGYSIPDGLRHIRRRDATEEFTRLQMLRWRLKARGATDSVLARKTERYEALVAEWTAIRDGDGGDGTDSPASADTQAALARAEADIRAFRKEQEMESMMTQRSLIQRIEERRGMQASPPLLMWDRRTIEPLIVRPSEFLPQQPMALLDIAPRSIWESLRADGLSNYDFFEFMLAALFVVPRQSVLAGLRALAPGAEEWIVPRCKSLRAVGKGGVVDLEMLTVRSLTEEMLREMFEAFMAWPFRPTKAQMLARGGSQDVHGDAEVDGMERLGGLYG